MASNRYWLSLGPITAEERLKAKEYLTKHNIPESKKTLQNRVARIRKRRAINRYLRGKEEAAVDPNTPWKVIYGDVETGGAITFIHTSGPADQKNLYLHLIITLAAHEIRYIRKVYFNGTELSWGATDLTTRPTGVVNAGGIFTGLVKMQINYGSDSQTALSEAVSDVGTKWTSDHRQRGHAHVYLRLRWNETVFKDGTPDISFLVSGKNDVVDPRTMTASPGASNAAMVLYDYMTNSRWGLGLSSTEFNSTRLIQAVNDCEDSIALAGGGSELRYLINTHFTTDASPGAIIEDMVTSMAGRLPYTAGQFSLWVGKARSSTVLTITADMILSDIEVLTKTPRIDAFNAVRGTFISETNAFEESDFPVVKNSTYETEDGGRIYEDLTYSMVTSPSRVQRLSKIELESNRQGIVVEFTARLDAYQAEPGEWVGLTYSRFGWTAKVFEVMRSTLVIEQDNSGNPYFAVRLMLQETSSGVYDWNTGNESTFDLAPNTDLPNPFTVGDPSGLSLASGTTHLYMRLDGTIFARLYAQWTPSDDAFVVNGGRYEIQYKKSADSVWLSSNSVPGESTNTYILDVQDGQFYDVRIRSVSAMAQRGNWVTATNHLVLGKTEPPTAPTSLLATLQDSGILLRWNQVADLDVREYELRYGLASQDWNTSTLIARIKSDRYFADKLPAGAYRFRVKSIDTTGNYSTGESTFDFTVSAPSAPRNVSISQIDNNVLIRWDPPESTVFSIAYYQVLRQSGTQLTEVGRATGTFSTYVELLSGEYTYRVTAIDVAGNVSLAGTSTSIIYPPPDFQLRATAAADLSTATLSNAAYIAENFSVEAATNTEETWEDHFVNNGFLTFQDFITAGFTYYLEPLSSSTGTTTFTTTEPSIWLPYDNTQTWQSHFIDNGFDDFQDFIDAGFTNYLLPNDLQVGSFGVEVDLGEVLPQTIVNFDYVSFGSGIEPVPVVSWRETTGDPWISGPVGFRRVTPSNFRYLKLSITVTPVTELDWCVVTDATASIQVKELTDSGTASVSSGDSGGTAISFTKSFLDVSSIVVTPQGTTELKSIVDFNDVPNPTTFKVLLFNAAGTRASGTIRWNARGVQAVL